MDRDKHGRPIFVTVQTSAYSGATLLGRLLGGHPEIATVGEMNGLVSHNDPEVYLCSCGSRIRECDFWKLVTSGMRKRGFEFDVADFGMAFRLNGPLPIHYLRRVTFRSGALEFVRDRVLRYWPGEHRQMKALVARNLAFIDTVLDITGKHVLVDTSKDRLRFRAFRQYADLDVRVIHIVRDVRGVVASRLRRGRARVDARMAARDWCRIHERIEATLGTLPPDRYIQVRYEDLCRDVCGTLAQLYRFCGVSPQVDAASLLRSTQHIVGNRMRLSELTDIQDIRIDERWRGLLTSKELEDIGQSACVLSRRYGYS